MNKEELKERVGKELYSKLSLEDREFIVKTAGQMKIKGANLKRMSKYIQDYRN